MFNLIQFILQMTPICFVFMLIVYKVYFKIRSRFKILVNCWFCNQNTKVPYDRRNDWTCSQCDQYNGFTKDGDYNREIIEQLDCSNNNGRIKYYTNPNYYYNDFINVNGFCDSCNENQRLKIEKLSQFEPKKESNFDNELETYKSHLEKEYRLCPSCERHLWKILRDKKKMVLGSKLLDFIVKGATNLTNHPQIKPGRTTKLKIIIAILIFIVAIINLFTIIRDLNGIIRKGLGVGSSKDFSETLTKFILNIITHILAFLKVIQIYLDKLITNKFLEKSYLFVKTLMSLSFTILGIKLPKEFCNGYGLFSVINIPFGSIFLVFIHSILDGFRLTRYTILLTIWSIYAGTINSEIFSETEIFKLIISIVTVILSLPQWRDCTKISMDSTGNSFHKIYSDYLDDSSISDLNNSSLCSNQSYASSIRQNKNSISPRIRTSSTLSLHKTQISPFKQFQINDDQQSYHNNRFTPIQQFPTNRSLFSSNIELNRSQLNLNNTNHLHNQSFCCSRNEPTINRTFSNILENDNNYNNSIYNKNIDLNHSFHHNIQPVISPAATIMTAQFPTQINPRFSYSNNSIYNLEQNNNQRATLLSPSRFIMPSSRFGSQSSWVSGGYFNNGIGQQQKCNSIDKPQQQNCFQPISAPLNTENLSRASSQSSGFESHSSSNQNNHNNGFIVGGNSNCGNTQQQSPLIMGRENSCCNDFDYYSIYSGDNFIFQQPQSNFDNNNYTRNRFDDTFRESMFRQRNSIKSLNIPVQQLSPSLNNSILYNNKQPSISVNDGFDWRQKSNRDITSRNSFNFNKIHEELPLIQKGSLLKKWQQQQQQENCFS